MKCRPIPPKLRDALRRKRRDYALSHERGGPPSVQPCPFGSTLPRRVVARSRDRARSTLLRYRRSIERGPPSARARGLDQEPRKNHIEQSGLNAASGVFSTRSLFFAVFLSSLRAAHSKRMCRCAPSEWPLEQGMAARRQSFTYAHWELRLPCERDVEVGYQNEYWWIESALKGAAQGTFETCTIGATIETKLGERFNRARFFRWQLPTTDDLPPGIA